MTLVLQVEGKNFKITMINMLKKKKLEEKMDLMRKEMRSFSNNLEN